MDIKSLTIPGLFLIVTLTIFNGVKAEQIIGCSNTLCGDFSASPISPLTTNFTAIPINGIAPFNFSWDFGDGTLATGYSVNHSFSSQNTYLVWLNITDSNSSNFSIAHDVTEVNPPSKPFITPTSPSWNSNVGCLASVARIPDILGNVTNAQGGADLSGAGSTSLLIKHSLNYPCSLFNFSVFVEIHNVIVTWGPLTTTDCSLVNETNSCDVVGRIADFNMPCSACANGTIYMEEMRWEVERQWNASGHDSSSLNSFGLPQPGQKLDVQGFLFWSFNSPADANHDYSGWYLELTSWRPSSIPSNQTLVDQNKTDALNAIINATNKINEGENKKVNVSIAQSLLNISWDYYDRGLNETNATLAIQYYQNSTNYAIMAYQEADAAIRNATIFGLSPVAIYVIALGVGGAFVATILFMVILKGSGRREKFFFKYGPGK